MTKTRIAVWAALVIIPAILIMWVALPQRSHVETEYVSPSDVFIRPSEVEDAQRKAEAGDTKAARDLAGYYLFGEGYDEAFSEAKSRHWNFVAAENGDVDTQKYLVHCYVDEYVSNPTEAKLLLQYAVTKNWRGAKAELDKIIKSEEIKAQKK